eukprot:SAG22_NODE_797_length_7135_cov_211.841103_7_plen_104_part_00
MTAAPAHAQGGHSYSPPPPPLPSIHHPRPNKPVSPPVCPALPQHATSLSDPQVGRGSSCLTNTSLEGEHHRWLTGEKTASRAAMEPAVDAPAEAVLGSVGRVR